MYRLIWALQRPSVTKFFKLSRPVLRLLDPRVVSGDFLLDKEPGDSGYLKQLLDKSSVAKDRDFECWPRESAVLRTRLGD